MAAKSYLNSLETSYIPIPESDAEKDSKNHDECKTKTVCESLQVKTNFAYCISSPLDEPELIEEDGWIEEDVNVAVEVLQMIFPDYSEESIRHVYFLNYPDVYDAFVMLKELGDSEGEEDILDEGDDEVKEEHDHQPGKFVKLESEFDEDVFCVTLDNNDNASESAPATCSASLKQNKFVTHIGAEV